jgi:segregation and condensation protein B
MAEPAELKNIVEAALLAAGRPLSLDKLQALFNEVECPEKKELRGLLEELADDYQGRGIEVAEVSSGWRIQVRKACSPWVSRLWDERPARYSRALMETLALIAYRQPITRGDIEDIRGVSVSTNIVKTLMEREWVHVVGHRDVPGKPSLYGTTREFLDYFGLKSLDELPTLAELRDLDDINRELDLNDPDMTGPRRDQAGPLSSGIAIDADAAAGLAGDSEIHPKTVADIERVAEVPATNQEAPRSGAYCAADSEVAADEPPAGAQGEESDVLLEVEAHAEVAAERS